ncbi:uncharacterized protein LOC127720644 [Mytilus californianus]|uniref:uncharacterized protein LOC127720644 n=1 Tax=Mytilus californianus TaxID=6549 RepID=UPI002245E8D4|nr:uncharacterized protein LOC127720644 [Mytilus californianus]
MDYQDQDMEPRERTNYFKLVALLFDIACHVLYTYIREIILDSSPCFELFLNLKKEKHKLIHLYETAKCCECISEPIKGETLISRKQLLLLYKSDETKKNRNHRKFAGNKVAQICICKYTAIENIDVKILDITLAYYIINKCGKQELGVDNWTSQIREERNKIFHISDTQKMTDDIFKRKWEKINGSIMGIANLINRTFAEETEKQILQTKKLTVIPAYMDKYEKMCRDYWKNKCAEFERAQVEEFEKKAMAFNLQFSEDCRESMGSDCQKHTKQIQNLKTRIDNIDILIKVFGEDEYMKTSNNTGSVVEDCQRVHVPVFLQLDVPALWNRTNILEYLDELRLNRKSDMNIKIMAISPDDLNIYSKIAKTVLRQIDLLQDEVQMIMSGMLSRASIDTKQSAEVVVSLTVPDTTEKNSAMKSKDADETSDNPLSIVDDQTRSNTELDEVLPTSPVKEIVKKWNKRENISGGQSSISRRAPDEVNSAMKSEEVEKTVHNPLSIHDDQIRPKTKFDVLGENSEIDSEDEAEKPESRSAIHDSKTRTKTEFVESYSSMNSKTEEEQTHLSSLTDDQMTNNTEFDVNYSSKNRKSEEYQTYSSTFADSKIRTDTEFNEKHSSKSNEEEKEQTHLTEKANDRKTSNTGIHENYCSKSIESEREQTYLSAIGDDQMMPFTEFKEPYSLMRNKIADDHVTNTEFDAPLTLSQGLVLDGEPLQITATFLRTIEIYGNFIRRRMRTSGGFIIFHCAIIGKLIVFLEEHREKLIVHNKEGKYKKELKLPKNSWGISVINDTEFAIAVNIPQYRDNIEIINIKTGQVKNRFEISGDTTGMSYQDGLLFVVIEKKKVDVINLAGELIRSFPCPSEYVWCIATVKDRLFLTNPSKNELYCCDLYGQFIWTFTNDQMQLPRGITTDGNGNVYVTCQLSSNVIVVLPDGIHHIELLSWKNENMFGYAKGIYYDKLNDCLLVSNGVNNNAFLYDIKHSMKGQ